MSDYARDENPLHNICPPLSRLRLDCRDKLWRSRPHGWAWAAFRRRALFFVLDGVTIWWLSHYAALLFQARDPFSIRGFTCLLFIILLSWIASNFWISALGFYSLMNHKDPYDIRNELKSVNAKLPRDDSVAVIMPVCNEDAAGVFARLKVLYGSIRDAGFIGPYNFFVLSDSTDPDRFIEEEILWASLCEELDAAGRLFYHRRKVRIKKKHGNIRNFCRRWGSKYEYILVVDADSIMTGELVNNMARVMEARPNIGILQSVPFPAAGKTLFSSVHKFAASVYGTLNVAGISFLQLGDSVFWGHNAMIRLKPYACHGVIPTLKGRPPFSGEILSHDFLEAAFMRKAGWEIWILQLPGSFEETPSNIWEEWERDGRWIYGDLQHIRYIFSNKVAWPHRFLLMQGVFFYLSSLLWFVFLILVSSRGFLNLFVRHDYFPQARQLFPEWPAARQTYMMYLLIGTLVFLFLPKILGIFYIAARRSTRMFGGVTRLITSAVLETVFFIILAPIKMVLQSVFILKIIISGKPVDWNAVFGSAKKHDASDAWRLFGPMMIGAIFFGVVTFFVDRSVFVWSLFIFVPMLLSVPFALYTADEEAAKKASKRVLFAIPYEVKSPPELVLFLEYSRQYRQKLSRMFLGISPFVKSITNKWVHDLHRSFLRDRNKFSPSVREDLGGIKSRLEQEGMESISEKEKRVILDNKELFSELFFHQE